MASIKGKVNLNDLKKFQNSMAKMNKSELKTWNEAMVKELAARLLAKVIKRTPVGKYNGLVSFTAKLPKRKVQFTTKDGKAVSFTAKAQTKQVQFQPHTGKVGGTLRRGWTVGEVKKQGNEYTIDVINPVFYAPYVEFGHRTPDHKGWVNGRFMLTISELELQKDAPKYMINKLNAFMGGIFK